MNTNVYLYGQSTPQLVAVPSPSAAPLAQVFPWLASGEAPMTLADEFAEFASESLEWADLVMSAALESWPDDDSSDQ